MIVESSLGLDGYKMVKGSIEMGTEVYTYVLIS